MIPQTRAWSPKYIENSHDSTPGRQTTQLKNGQRTWTDTSPRKTYRGPRDIWKMLSITSHQRDANWNHNEIPPDTGQNGQHKQIHKQMLERMWRKGNPTTLLVVMQTGVAPVENSMEFPQKTKSGTSLCPSNSTAGTVSYTHLTLPTSHITCRSRWSPYH